MSDEFFHPSEKEFVRGIAKCADLHKKIRHFQTKYGACVEQPSPESRNDIPRGLYLQALADSLKVVLEPFHIKLLELTENHLQNPDLHVTFYHKQIKSFEPFFRAVLSLIGELETGQFHGCAILKLLHKHSFNGDVRIMNAIRIIRQNIYGVWLRQLSQWLIYGRLTDVYNEFFIVHCDVNKAKGIYSTLGGTMPTQNASGSCVTISDSASAINADLWHFEVCYEMLPPNFTPSWAEKVLFIGQTVRMLNADPRRLEKKSTSDWSNSDSVTEIGSLWNKQEHVFFEKLQTLYDNESIDVSAYESVVNEIKLFVTERLSEIAFNQADLIKHLHIVKDFYLLGRGELFLEFIQQTEALHVDREGMNEYLARDVSRAFQVALNRTFVELEQLTLSLPLNEIESIELDAADDDPHLFLRFLAFKFKVKWPLHLFFSPTILKRYNQLFRFLLQIRKIQNNLHNVWRLHRDRKIAGNTIISQLRNQMLFLIDNLQYYLQVDVIESQFSILQNAVQNSKDFEMIQRAHSVFQANVMCLCFQLNSSVTDNGNGVGVVNNLNGSHTKTNEVENPVLTILNKIMRTIRFFCRFNAMCSDPMTHEDQQQLELSDSL